MPELPEVEVIRRRLIETVLGRTIAGVRTTGANYAFLTPPSELRRRLLGRRFEGIERRGKYLLFGLEDQSCLVIHLGMTGQLFSSRALSPRLVQRSLRKQSRETARFEPDKHTHLSIAFADQADQLHFRDCRKFGKILWIDAHGSDARLMRLGPDAAGITARKLAAALAGRRAAIKPLLLDQSTLAGVGNIYADESLHAAGILPTRLAHTLVPEEIDLLARAIRRVLKRAIALGGSSIDDYLHPDGSDGSFQKRFKVYGRDGQPCRRCGAPIRRAVIAQRSAHFCSACQK
jgi:formamidopyrimidine-DNA glycosylase